MAGSALTVDVISGRDVTGGDQWGKIDPYVVCKLESSKFKSKWKNSTKTPVWNENFSFPVTMPGALIVELFDYDTIGKDDLCGMIEIPLSSLEDQERHNEWYTIRSKKGTKVGEVNLEMQWWFSKVKYYTLKKEVWDPIIAKKDQQMADIDSELNFIAELMTPLPWVPSPEPPEEEPEEEKEEIKSDSTPIPEPEEVQEAVIGKPVTFGKTHSNFTPYVVEAE